MAEPGEVKEAVELAPCSESGARIIQLTTSDAVFVGRWGQSYYLTLSRR